MAFFSTKSFDERLVDTAAFIGKSNSGAGEKVYHWGLNCCPHEMRRIGEKLHIGNKGTKRERQYRRAIMLMRAAVLRHEINKVVSEVTAVPSSGLQARFNIVAGLCVNRVDHHPSGLDVMAGESNAKIEKEQSKRLRPILSKIKAGRINLAHEIYIPVHPPSDTAIDNTEHYIKHKLCKDWQKKSKTVGDALTDLDSGGELFIIGHGNLGTGIGTHSKEYGARELVAQLRKDKLKRNPNNPLIIYLFSCWTATHTRRAFGGFGKREPFARRFARALAKAGFSNVKVVGFAGSVSEGSLVQDYENVRGVDNPGTHSLGYDGMYSVYEIGGGDFNRTHGEDWTTKAKPNLHSVEFWKGWCDLTVRRRGGKFNTWT